MTVFRKAQDGWVEVPAADDTDIIGSLESFVDQAGDDDRLLISPAQARQIIDAVNGTLVPDA